MFPVENLLWSDSENQFNLLFILCGGVKYCLFFWVFFLLGANVNCQAKDKATPLLIAAQEGHTECVELLLASGADANLYCNEDNWQLPIHAAAEMGHKK